MEKIKQGQLITLTRLNAHIHHYLCNKQPCPIDISKSKYPVDLLREIPSSFISNLILYCLSQQLKTAMPDSMQPFIVEQIKNVCFDLSMGPWKEQFHFDHAMVYLTKIISGFYEQSFEGIKTCIALQAEIYIVLVHSILGITVGLKCYQILQKKFWRKTLRKIKPYETLRHRSTNRRTLIKRRQTKDSVANPSYSSICKSQLKENKFEGDHQFQSFKKNLKDSLYVDPLPKKTIKKKSIQSFCQATSLPPTLRHSKPQALSFNKTSYTKKTMTSTQMSEAFLTELRKRKISAANYYRAFKIQHRIPFFSNHNVIKINERSMDTCEGNNCKKAEEKKQHNKIENREWMEMIKGMKQFRGGQAKIKLELQSKFEKQSTRNSQKQDAESNGDEEIISNSMKRLKKQQSSVPQTSEKVEKLQKTTHAEKKPITKLEQRVRTVLKEEQIEEQYRQKTVHLWHSSLDPRILKENKHIFEELCKKRKQKIEYSMFMMPGIKAKHGP